MTGADEIGAAGIAVGETADRRGAILGGDAGGRAVAVIDRDRKRGAVDRVAVGDHRREVQPARDLAGHRGADDAAGMADDERHLLRRGMGGGDDQIALVFAVVIIGDDDDLAAGKGVDGFPDARLGARLGGWLNARLGHGPYSPKPFAARNSGLSSRNFHMVRRHNIARATAARASHASNAPTRKSAAKRLSSGQSPSPSRFAGPSLSPLAGRGPG